MLSDQELEELLLDLESDRVERKESLSDSGRIRQAICAYANDMPGHQKAGVTWFSDRIEIQNPGGPFGQVTAENFGSPGITDYRNPHLAEALRTLGFVQRFGVGIALARKFIAENENPPLEFKVQANHVLAIMRRCP